MQLRNSNETKEQNNFIWFHTEREFATPLCSKLEKQVRKDILNLGNKNKSTGLKNNKILIEVKSHKGKNQATENRKKYKD